MRNLNWKPLLILAAALLISCTGGGGENDATIGEIVHPAYVPHIEQIQAPEVVQADESFDVVIRVSADQNPSILRGRDIGDLQIVDGGSSSNKQIHKAIYVFFLEGGGGGAAQYEYNVQVTMSDPGDAELLLYSAPSRALGGLDASYVSGPGRYIYPMNPAVSLTCKSVMVTVLPAEE